MGLILKGAIPRGPHHFPYEPSISCIANCPRSQASCDPWVLSQVPHVLLAGRADAFGFAYRHLSKGLEKSCQLSGFLS